MAHKIKISLDCSEPKISRTVVVPEIFTFEQLHKLIQLTMGWDNSHLHEFNFGSVLNRVTITSTDVSDEPLWEDHTNYDEVDTTINDILPLIKNKLNYVYDFGDSWDHTITFLKKPKEEVIHPMCLKAHGPYIIDDCGGVWGFYEMYQILQSNDKDFKKEKKEYMEWLHLEKNETYDSVYGFDIDESNNLILELFNK